MFAEVAALLAEILGEGPVDRMPGMALVGNEQIAPLDVAKLVMACEQRFCVTIHDEDVQDFHTLQDLAAYIERLLEDGHTNRPLLQDEDRVNWYYL